MTVPSLLQLSKVALVSCGKEGNFKCGALTAFFAFEHGFSGAMLCTATRVLICWMRNCANISSD